LDISVCQQDPVECEESANNNGHLWAHCSLALICFLVAVLMALSGIEQYLTMARLLRSQPLAPSSVVDAVQLVKRQPRPLGLFFTDGFVDINRTIRKSRCSLMHPLLPLHHRLGSALVHPRIARKHTACSLGVAVAVAPVFLSSEEAVHNGSTVFAWARSTRADDTWGEARLQWAVPTHMCSSNHAGTWRHSLRGAHHSSSNRNSSSSSFGAGLCGLLPETLVRRIKDFQEDRQLLDDATREFAAQNPQHEVPPDVPFLIFVDPKEARQFPPALVVALAFFALSMLVTCCPFALALLPCCDELRVEEEQARDLHSQHTAAQAALLLALAESNSLRHAGTAGLFQRRLGPRWTPGGIRSDAARRFATAAGVDRNGHDSPRESDLYREIMADAEEHWPPWTLRWERQPRRHEEGMQNTGTSFWALQREHRRRQSAQPQQQQLLQQGTELQQQLLQPQQERQHQQQQPQMPQLQQSDRHLPGGPSPGASAGSPQLQPDQQPQTEFAVVVSTPAESAAPSEEVRRDDGGSGDGHCVICCSAPKDALLAPCGHVATCVACAHTLLQAAGGQAQCPICRGQVIASYRVFNT